MIKKEGNIGIEPSAGEKWLEEQALVSWPGQGRAAGPRGISSPSELRLSTHSPALRQLPLSRGAQQPRNIP